MSLLRIPCSIAVIWAVHVTLTPPQPPPKKEEEYADDRLKFSVTLLPTLFKILHWTLGIMNILTVLGNSPSLANHYPSLSKLLLVIVPHADTHLTPSFIVAWASTMMGAFIRLSCYNYMKELFTFELTLRKNHRLVTNGPYSIVRHPSYTGIIFSLFGALGTHTTGGSWFIAVLGNWLPGWAVQAVVVTLFGLLTVLSLLILPRMGKEDKALRKHFGAQWDEWAKKVPYKMVPGIY